MIHPFELPRSPRHLLVGAVAILCTVMAGCDGKTEVPAAAPAALLPAATSAASPPAPTVALRNECGRAMQQLRQCHQQAVASGKASPAQLAQSTTYLRRLEAWWQMDGGNPAIQATCAAIASDKDSCAPDGDPTDAEDAGMSDEHFKQVMKQFDAAGVPP